MPQTLLDWVKRVEVDSSVREGVTTSEAQRVMDLERENCESLGFRGADFERE